MPPTAVTHGEAIQKHFAQLHQSITIKSLLHIMARGGRGGGRTGGGAMSRDVQVSKKLSWLLRHGAEKEGLELGRGGYVRLSDVVSPSALISASLVHCACHKMFEFKMITPRRISNSWFSHFLRNYSLSETCDMCNQETTMRTDWEDT